MSKTATGARSTSDTTEDGRIIQRLIRLLGEDRVLHHPHQLAAYECDAYVAQTSLPRAVVFPESTVEVAEIVRMLHEAQIPFLPRGAGTGLSGGAMPMNREVVLSLVRMNRLLTVDFENLRAVVQPGLVNLQLTRKISGQGCYYAPDPSSQSVCTIGGNLAENAGGSHCLKYGVTTNHIVAAEVVLPTGDIVHVGSEFGDATGYDLLGLIVGSEGTLGIATEITVKILKRPESVRTALAMFDAVDDAAAAVTDIIGAGIVPAAMEMMDQLAMQAVDKSHYHVGYPPDIDAVLLIEVDGMEAGLDEVAEEIVDICRTHRVRTVKVAATDAERALWWSSRKMAFGATGRISPDYIVQDGVIPRTKLSQVLAVVRHLSETSGLRISNVFHAGDGNLHPLICYDASVPGQTELAIRVGSDILKACVEAGGSITGEHGVGVEKVEEMRYMFSDDDLQAQVGIRQVFNPDDLCNSGKLIPRPARCAEVKHLQKMIEKHQHVFGGDQQSTTIQ